MNSQFLLTPYFLHQHAPGLARLAGSDWRRNEPTLASSGQVDRMAVLLRQIAAFVTDSVHNGARPVSVSGDCCSAIGVLAGLQRAGIDPAVIWLDAHGDFNTHETTVTGFLGGMPLAMLTGRGDQTLMRGAACRPIPDEHVVLADARDLDPAERGLLEASAVRRAPDPSGLVEMIPPDRPLYVHFDTDFLNPLDAPSMLYSAAGGPRLDDALALAGEVARTNRIAAVSVTAWDLDKDADRRTERACLGVLDALIAGGAPALPQPRQESSAASVRDHVR